MLSAHAVTALLSPLDLSDSPFLSDASLDGPVGPAGPCRAACEASEACGGFVHVATATASSLLSVANCTFYSSTAQELFASSLAADAGAASSLHLYEFLSFGGAALVAAGGQHSLAAAGLTMPTSPPLRVNVKN